MCRNEVKNRCFDIIKAELQHFRLTSNELRAFTELPHFRPNFARTSELRSNFRTSLELPNFARTSELRSNFRTSLELPNFARTSELRSNFRTSLELPNFRSSPFPPCLFHNEETNIDEKLTKILIRREIHRMNRNDPSLSSDWQRKTHL